MVQLLKNSRVLVTGGAGFIGSSLVESLLKSGNKVTCLDNFSTGKRENLRDFISDPDFKLIEGDIRDYDACAQSVADIEYVFHQAALGSVPRSILDPVSTTDVNIGGFVKMLFAAKEAGIRRFIYAASSSAYGDHPDLPKVEDKIGVPLSPYGITKYAGELYAGIFSRTYGMETIGLRYFNVFGRRQDPDGAYAAVIPKFVKSLLNHESPVINGDGSISRDFTYIDNVIQANHLAAVTDRKDAVNEIYNVACGESMSLNELFEHLRSATGKYDPEILKILPAYGPGRDGDILHSVASIRKANELLGYSPSYSVSEGLREAIEWYRENL